jgi:hypothetical protein
MTAAHLRPCPGCSRHVRVSEGACPFCGVLLEPAFHVAPAPVGPSKRLSRAALFAFGTGAAVLSPVVVVDCGTDGYALMPPYGHGPVFPDDGGEGAQDSSYVLADVQVASVDAGLPDSGVGAPDGAGGNGDDGDSSVEDASSEADLYFDDGGFPCGPYDCNPAAAFCLTFTVEIGPPGSAVAFSCDPLPAACLSSPTCTCLTGNYDAGFVQVQSCDGGADMGITLTGTTP